MRLNLLANSATTMLLGLCLCLPTSAQQSQQSSRQQSRLRLDPQGQVVIGIDTNGDQRFETIESISLFQLETAMKRSAERQNQGNGQSGMAQQRQQSQTRAQNPQNRQRFNQSNQRKSRQLKKISGTITESVRFTLADGQQHQFIKVETPDGKKIPVDLGRIEQVEQLKLQDGDKVTIVGQRARMNDKKFLCARRIETENRTMNVSREKDRGLKRVQGEITSLSTKRLRNKEQPFKVAKVELRGGRTETVILGPANRLEQVDIQKGDTVQLLVRRGRFNNQPALIADQLRFDDRTVRITRPEGQVFTTKQDR